MHATTLTERVATAAETETAAMFSTLTIPSPAQQAMPIKLTPPSANRAAVMLTLGTIVLTEATAAASFLTLTPAQVEVAAGEEQRAAEFQSTLWVNPRFAGFMLVASMLGGMLAVSLLPGDTQGDPVRRLSLKMACSAICGILFAPWLMDYSEVAFTDINVMAWAGACSFLGVTTIKLLTPLYERIVRAWAEAKSPKG